MRTWLHQHQFVDTDTSRQADEEWKQVFGIIQAREEEIAAALTCMVINDQTGEDTLMVTRLRERVRRCTNIREVRECKHDNEDWREFYGVTLAERGNCCSCGYPAHHVSSGYCQATLQTDINVLLSSLLTTPIVSADSINLEMTTSPINKQAWDALQLQGFQPGVDIVPLFSACAWGDTGKNKSWMVSE